jgi:AbrB family looped-hinge helix DNA binding protein
MTESDTGKATRCIDDLGRVVIPKWMRERIGVEMGDALEMRIYGCRIIITKTEQEAQNG